MPEPIQDLIQNFLQELAKELSGDYGLIGLSNVICGIIFTTIGGIGIVNIFKNSISVRKKWFKKFFFSIVASLVILSMVIFFIIVSPWLAQKLSPKLLITSESTVQTQR